MASKLNIDDSDPYRLVEGAINLLPGPLPTFLHKWTGKVRQFNLEEVQLPRLLFSEGERSILRESVLVGIGGSRSPTAKTFALVRDLVEYLASREIGIISGGVPGVDLAAHLAAADHYVSNYAVLANPVEMAMKGHEWYSRRLEDAIRKRGAFLSEYVDFLPIDSAGFRERLLQRDRIISGLSNAFIAFECSVGSATVDTARRALVQGKRVFAINSDAKSNRKGFLELCQIPGVVGLDPAEMSIDLIGQTVADSVQALSES